MAVGLSHLILYICPVSATFELVALKCDDAAEPQLSFVIGVSCRL